MNRIQYENALAEIEHIMNSDPPADSLKGKRLKGLAEMVQEYERKHFKFETPTAQQMDVFRKENLEIKIYCHTCKNKPPGSGCHRCGGFRYILERDHCPVCRTEFWSRNMTGTTIYAGKVFTSFDGLDLIHTDNGFMCMECWEKVK